MKFLFQHRIRARAGIGASSAVFQSDSLGRLSAANLALPSPGTTAICGGSQRYYLTRNSPKSVSPTVPTVATVTPTVLPDYPRYYVNDEDCASYQVQKGAR